MPLSWPQTGSHQTPISIHNPTGRAACPRCTRRCPSWRSLSQERALGCSRSLAEGCNVPFRLAETTQCCSCLVCRFRTFHARTDLLSRVVLPGPLRVSQLQSSLLLLMHLASTEAKDIAETSNVYYYYDVTEKSYCVLSVIIPSSSLQGRKKKRKKTNSGKIPLSEWTESRHWCKRKIAFGQNRSSMSEELKCFLTTLLPNPHNTRVGREKYL